MIIEQFIDEKILQLHAYVSAVIEQRLHYTELDRFILDTMSDWTLLSVDDETPHSAKERVFWHLLHQVHYWNEDKLINDQFLVDELNNCVNFLEGLGHCPLDCVGIRP